MFRVEGPKLEGHCRVHSLRDARRHRGGEYRGRFFGLQGLGFMFVLILCLASLGFYSNRVCSP